MQWIVNFIVVNKLEVPLIAALTVIVTGVVKLPVKNLAAKLKNGNKLTKYITLLPVIFGFALSVGVTFLCSGVVSFDEDFFATWVSSVSLSLAVYAFWEKFVPSEKKILTRAEIEANKQLVESFKSGLAENESEEAFGGADVEALAADEEVEDKKELKGKKIILKNLKK